MHRSFNFDIHTQELFRGATIAFIVKILAAGMGFFLNIVLARLLGAKESGIFYLSFTIILVVATISRLGFENTVVKFIAANVAARKPQKVIGVYKKTVFYSFITASFFSLVCFFIGPWASENIFSKSMIGQPLSIMSIAIVPLSLLTLNANALQGLKKIATSIITLNVIVPFFTSIMVVLQLPSSGIIGAAWSYLIATIIAFVFGRWNWKKAMRGCFYSTPEFSTKELLNSSMPLLGATILNLIISWSPTLLLGIWETNENIGIFSAANRTSMLISFILMAVNSIAAPQFAALYQQDKLMEIGKLSRNSSKFMVILTLPILIIFFVFPESILSVFGEQFIKGSQVLMILSFGQFINVATGSVNFLLMMSGNERLMRNNLLFCAICGVLSNSFFIPKYGILGAAYTTSFFLSIQNLVSVIIVWKKLDILTLPWLNNFILRKNKT